VGGGGEKVSLITTSQLRWDVVKNTYLVSQIPICKMVSQILELRKAIGIFKYQLVLQIPIGTSNTNWYFKYQLLFEVMSATFC
jgi:hypothetical protein